MDKLTPSFQDTPLTTQSAGSVSSWYTSETTSGVFTPNEVGWLHGQGWRTYALVTEGGQTTYFLTRRVLKPEGVLRELVTSYTAAYNEGRALNDQRYDDLLVIYMALLDKTEDTYNELETYDDTFTTTIETILTDLEAGYDAYAADVDGDLDAWGVSLLAEINARFDAELSKGQQSLLDRGLYTSSLWTTISAGIERERTRALNDANDKIAQRQLELKHKVYAELDAMRGKLLAARDRLASFWHSARDQQVSVRNSVAEALARFVERREDTYPDLSEVGRLAAGIGAGSPEAFAP